MIARLLGSHCGPGRDQGLDAGSVKLAVFLVERACCQLSAGIAELLVN